MAGDIRRLFTASAVVAAVMAVSAGARADFIRGDELYDLCTSANAFDRQRCAGYVEGIADASRKYFDPSISYTNCLRDPQSSAGDTPIVTPEQATDIVVRFMARHPDQNAHFSAAALVSQALAEAFPCKLRRGR